MRLAGRALLATVVALVGIASVFSQEPTSGKIPRRVYFPPAVVAPGITDATLLAIPDYLYTAISALQPIVRVDSTTKANSVVEVSISDPGPSVVVRLMNKNVEAAKVSFVAESFTDVARYVEKTARDLAPRLGMVAPTVEQTNEQGVVTKNQALIQKVQIADRFARPLELSIEGPSLIRTSSGGSSGSLPVGIDPVPVVFQVAYFLSRSIGIDASLLSYYGTRLGFGRPQNSSSGQYTRSFLLLPGVGVKYRSLGAVFATFSAAAYAGYGYVTNISSLPLGSNTTTGFQLFLDPGASKSIFYTLLRFSSDFGYNISPKLAAHLGVALNLNPIGIAGGTPLGYPTDDNSFFLQYLTVGLSYRP